MDYYLVRKIWWMATIFRRAGLNLKNYLQNLKTDYLTVARDFFVEAKNKPFKTAFYASALSFFVYTYKQNPDLKHYENRLNFYRLKLCTLSDLQRNSRSENYLHRALTLTQNEQRIERLNLLIFSILYTADYSTQCRSFASQCKEVGPSWRERLMGENFLDFGVWNRWYFLESKMIDYDTDSQASSNVWQENFKI
uniref:Uncharacterized protein n=1 Tax=Romanomermis culicivorax TaxID=13658 RepID=A0A915L6M1_ROMCU